MSEWTFWIGLVLLVILFADGPDGYDLHDALLARVAGVPLTSPGADQ